MFHSGLCTFRRFIRGGNYSLYFLLDLPKLFIKSFSFVIFLPKTNAVKNCEQFNGILICLPYWWPRSSCQGSLSVRVPPSQLDLTQHNYVGLEDKIKTCCLRQGVCGPARCSGVLMQLLSGGAKDVAGRRGGGRRCADHPHLTPPHAPPLPSLLATSPAAFPCEGLVSLQI